MSVVHRRQQKSSLRAQQFASQADGVPNREVRTEPTDLFCAEPGGEHQGKLEPPWVRSGRPDKAAACLRHEPDLRGLRAVGQLQLYRLQCEIVLFPK